MSQTDYNFVQGVRKIHDKQFTQIEPHFTIVFPETKLSGSELLEHVGSLDLDTKPFVFKLTTVVVKENTFQKSFQIHLVTDEPIPKLVRLHDLLYTGELESELRKDFPYVPHITIASNEDKVVIRKLADEINAKGLEINGRIDEITASSFDGAKVVNLKQFHLY